MVAWYPIFNTVQNFWETSQGVLKKLSFKSVQELANEWGLYKNVIQLLTKNDMFLVCGKLCFASTINKSHIQSQCLKE